MLGYFTRWGECCRRGQPTWISEVEISHKGDGPAQELIIALAVDPNIHPDYNFSAGILRFKSKLYAGKTTALRQQNPTGWAFSAIGGHQVCKGPWRGCNCISFGQGWKNMCKNIRPSVTSAKGVNMRMWFILGCWSPWNTFTGLKPHHPRRHWRVTQIWRKVWYW